MAEHALTHAHNLASLLAQQAQTQPDAPALIDYPRGRRQVMTFAQLEHATAQAAALLHQTGLAPGDRVLIFHPMAAGLYVALGAIFRLGLVALFVDPGMGRGHIDRCCELAPPKALLATPKAHLLRVVSGALRRIPIQFSTGWWVPGATRWQKRTGLEPLSTLYPATSETPALATFTSGSTGQPKLAIRTHGFLANQHAVLESTLGLRATGQEDTAQKDTGAAQPRVLTTLPIFVLSHLASGVCTVIPNVDIRRPGAVDAEPIFQSLETDAVTCLEGSPAFLARLAPHAAPPLKAAHRPAPLTTRQFPQIDRVFTGGAPVFPRLLDAVQQLAPNATLTAVYGSTEAEPIAHITRDELTPADRQAMNRGAGLPAGLPVGQISVEILPDRWGTAIGPLSRAEFAAQCLAAGETGEIVVSGSHVLPGYWQGRGDAESKIHVFDDTTDDSADATVNATVNATAEQRTRATTIWHRTGDAGYLDAEGRLWLLGRCSARIDDALGTLYPFAVECAAQEHPAVRQAALVQVHARRVLALSLYTAADQSQLQQLRTSLAWAGIEQILCLDTLPVDLRHNAKIDYARLQKQLEARR